MTRPIHYMCIAMMRTKRSGYVIKVLTRLNSILLSGILLSGILLSNHQQTALAVHLSTVPDGHRQKK
jgi:hypothetical protein